MGRVEGKVALISGAARGQGREHDIELHRSGASLVGFDEAKQQPIQERPGICVQLRKAGRIQGSASADGRQLADERLARRDESRRGARQGRAARCQPGGLVLDDSPGLCLEAPPTPGVARLRVEI